MSRNNHMYSSVRSTSTQYGIADQGSLWRSTTSNATGQWNPVRSGMSPQSKTRSYKVWECAVRCFNAKIVTVEPIVFLFMFAYYFYKVIFELYTFKRYGTEKIIDERDDLPENYTFDFCLSTKDLNNFSNVTGTGDAVEQEVALLTLFVGIIARLPSVVASLILGPLSDRFGRKPTLCVILCGMLLHAVGTIVLIENNLDMHYFILAGALRGMGGGIAGILTASYSYIADVSSRKWLVVRLGLLEAMTFIAGTLSLVVGGVWSSVNGCHFRPLAWVLLGCMVVALPYTLLILPESLDKEGITLNEREKKKKPKPLVGPKALLRGFHIFFGNGYPRCKLWLLLLVMALTIINTTGTVAIFTLFLLREPLQWDPLNIGIYLATSELIHGIALIVLLPILVYAGVHDEMIAVIGIVLSLGANVCLVFVDMTWQVYTIGAIQGIDALILPGIKAIMSKTVHPADHGALFSFVSAAQVLASVLAYAIYVPMYSATLNVPWKHASGISFFAMAFLYVLMLPLMSIIMYLQRRERQSGGNSPSPSPSHQPPQRTITPSINTPSSTHGDPFHKTQSELGQDAVERRSLLGSTSLGGSHRHSLLGSASLGASHELERSLQSSGSYRGFH